MSRPRKFGPGIEPIRADMDRIILEGASASAYNIGLGLDQARLLLQDVTFDDDDAKERILAVIRLAQDAAFSLSETLDRPSDWVAVDRRTASAS